MRLTNCGHIKAGKLMIASEATRRCYYHHYSHRIFVRLLFLLCVVFLVVSVLSIYINRIIEYL